MLSSPRSLSKKVYRRGEHGSPGTPQSSLRLASSSVEEPKEKSPLIEEMPDRAGELSCPFEKGYLETQQRANSVRPYGGAYVPLEKAPVGCALC